MSDIKKVGEYLAQDKNIILSNFPHTSFCISTASSDSFEPLIVLTVFRTPEFFSSKSPDLFQRQFNDSDIICQVVLERKQLLSSPWSKALAGIKLKILKKFF